jgi:hypothetical protein
MFCAADPFASLYRSLQPIKGYLTANTSPLSSLTIEWSSYAYDDLFIANRGGRIQRHTSSNAKDDSENESTELPVAVRITSNLTKRHGDCQSSARAASISKHKRCTRGTRYCFRFQCKSNFMGRVTPVPATLHCRLLSGYGRRKMNWASSIMELSRRFEDTAICSSPLSIRM